jgi:hypothetical protein
MSTHLLLLQLWLLDLPDRLRARSATDDGQSTAEYALVVLGAAGVAMLLVTWATKSGGISRILNSVLDGILGKIL